MSYYDQENGCYIEEIIHAMRTLFDIDNLSVADRKEICEGVINETRKIIRDEIDPELLLDTALMPVDDPSFDEENQFYED